MTILKECANMVKGMADYYSDEKLDLAALEEALRPFLQHLRKDAPGYLDVKKKNDEEYARRGE
ncbi:hypothetical protein [Pseudomonas sp.]|uniref:hypothetical protein n=1 Tax=Pseudomonas sp. TaxID=306 RepID=UPI003FD74AAB